MNSLSQKMKIRPLTKTLFDRPLFVILAAALCACIIALWKNTAEPTYRGKTIEEWFSSPDWTERKSYVELVIITEFGDQSVPVLKEILLRKGAKQELAYCRTSPWRESSTTRVSQEHN